MPSRSRSVATNQSPSQTWPVSRQFKLSDLAPYGAPRTRATRGDVALLEVMPVLRMVREATLFVEVQARLRRLVPQDAFHHFVRHGAFLPAVTAGRAPNGADHRTVEVRLTTTNIHRRTSSIKHRCVPARCCAMVHRPASAGIDCALHDCPKDRALAAFEDEMTRLADRDRLDVSMAATGRADSTSRRCRPTRRRVRTFYCGGLSKFMMAGAEAASGRALRSCTANTSRRRSTRRQQPRPSRCAALSWNSRAVGDGSSGADESVADELDGTRGAGRNLVPIGPARHLQDPPSGRVGQVNDARSAFVL